MRSRESGRKMPNDPEPDEIAALTAAIRDHWSPREMRNRAAWMFADNRVTHRMVEIEGLDRRLPRSE